MSRVTQRVKQRRRAEFCRPTEFRPRIRAHLSSGVIYFALPPLCEEEISLKTLRGPRGGRVRVAQASRSISARIIRFVYSRCVAKIELARSICLCFIYTSYIYRVPCNIRSNGPRGGVEQIGVKIKVPIPYSLSIFAVIVHTRILQMIYETRDTLFSITLSLEINVRVDTCK